MSTTATTAPSVAGLVTALSSVLVAEKAVKGVRKPNGKTNRQPKRHRCSMRDALSAKQTASLLTTIKGRKLTAEERGAIAFLSTAQTRESGGGR